MVTWSGLPERTELDVVRAGEVIVESTAPIGAVSDLSAEPGVDRPYELRWLLPDGREGTTSCGSAGLPEQMPDVACSVGVEGGIPIVRHDAETAVRVLASGEVVADRVIGSPVVHLDPVRAEQIAYEVVVLGSRGRSDRSSPCGSVLVGEAGDVGRLRALAATFADVSAAPYVYATVAPDCDGCPGVEIAVLGRAAAAVASPSAGELAELDALGFGGDGGAAVFLDPTTAHERLVAAVEAGRSVDFTADPATGALLSYSIDGDGARLLCLAPDTAPPDQRASLACDRETDLLG